MREIESMSHRVRIVCLSLAAAVAVMVLSAPRAEGLPKELPPQTLAFALEVFAKETGLQVLYSPEVATGLMSPGAAAGRSTEETLRELLRDTGLTFEFVNERTVTILPRGAASRGARANYDEAARQSGADIAQYVRPVGVAAHRLSLAAADESTAAKQSAQSPANKDEKDSIPEVLVKSSKMLNMDIRRSVDDPQPYVIFGREQIERSGAVNLEDFVRGQLTMNTTSTTLSQSAGALAGAASTINLRGLGSNQTLILIDGHRVPDFSIGNSTTQASINGIPLEAVERIEVLPTTAGGIYGGSATGGVVNIILRRDYSGVETKLTYNNTFDTDSAIRRVDISSGFSLEGGRTSVLMAGTYSETNPLLVRDRDFAEKGRARILANNPSFFLSSATPPMGSTTNIRSQDGSPLVLKNNSTPLGFAYTHVPVGYLGARSDNGVGLIANAGRYNLNLANSAQNFQESGGRGLLNGPTLESLMFTVRREFSSRVEGFLEGAASNNIGSVPSSFITANFTLPASAPTNPFQQAINVSVPTSALDGVFSSTNRERRIVAGAIVKLPKDWQGEADYTWHQYSLTYIGPQRTAASLTTAVTSGQIDVLRDTGTYPLDLSPYAVEGGRLNDGKSALQAFTVRVGGSAFTLPGGPARLAGMLERRDMHIDESTEYGSLGVSNIFPERSQVVNSAYLELRVPLISARNAKPGVKELELQVAGRWDEYTTESYSRRTSFAQTAVHSEGSLTSANPTVALRYQPFEDITLRASWGTGFLPPSVDQVVMSPFNSTLTVQDRRRGNTTLTTLWRNFGGSASLEPEESESWSLGIILTPRRIEGLRLSVDYTRIEKDNNIYRTFDGQFFVDNEARFPETVIRGAVPVGDPYGVGPIVAIDTLLVNISRAEVEAYDLKLDYRLPFTGFGNFDVFALSTWQTHYRTQVAPELPVVENVGITRNNPLKFRASVGVTWTHGGWTAGWNTRYLDSYIVSTAAATIANQGGPTVPDQLYHDVNAGYAFPAGPGLFDRTQIQLGVRNVFNKKPPFDATDYPYYSTYGDPRLANYYLSLKKAF